jgi:hypothetical protein
MRFQHMHVKGLAAGVVTALWAVVVIGSAHASTMPPPDEPAAESSSVATPNEQGELGVQAGPVQEVSVAEDSPVHIESSVASTNEQAVVESAIGLRVPTDGIRQRVRAIGEVVGQPAGRVLLSVNDAVTLKFNRAENTQPHQRYAIARRGQFVEHPESGRDMGYLVRVVGMVELEQAFGRYWSGRIVSATDYVAIDDVVLPLEPIAEESAGMSPDRTGRIVAVQDNLVLTATSQVVFTDLGSDRGAKPGDEFTIIREGAKDRRGFPDRSIGVLRVVATQPMSSSASITRSTEPIEIGDRLDPVGPGVSPQ